MGYQNPTRTFIRTSILILLQALSGYYRGFPTVCLDLKRTLRFLSGRPSWRFSRLQGLPHTESVAWPLARPARASRALPTFRVLHLTSGWPPSPAPASRVVRSLRNATSEVSPLLEVFPILTRGANRNFTLLGVDSSGISPLPELLRCFQRTPFFPF